MRGRRKRKRRGQGPRPLPRPAGRDAELPLGFTARALVLRRGPLGLGRGGRVDGGDDDLRVHAGGVLEVAGLVEGGMRTRGSRLLLLFCKFILFSLHFFSPSTFLLLRSLASPAASPCQFPTQSPPLSHVSNQHAASSVPGEQERRLDAPIARVGC